MKNKKIPTAQMGRSYINRRGYKSAGAEAPKKEETSSKTRTTKAPATGSDITKYTSNYKSDAIKRAAERYSIIPALGVKYTSVVPGPVYRSRVNAQQKSADEYYKKLTQGSYQAPKSDKSESKKVVKREKAEAIKVPERKKPELKIAAPLDKTLRTGPEKRKFSKGEIKIMEIMQKGKKKDGTMKEGAQRKIQAVRTKERLAAQKIKNKAERVEKVENRAENKIKRIQNRTENKLKRIENRAENKTGRVAKRAAIGEAKANVKAVRKSFKK